MKLSRHSINQLQMYAIKAAETAGQYVRKIHLNRKTNIFSIDVKNDAPSHASSIVTEVDYTAQEIILSILMPTLSRYSVGLLTEEDSPLTKNISSNSRFEYDYFWCIDPIDGTLPFTEGVKGFSVCIALVRKDGTPVIGVIFDSESNTLYHTSAPSNIVYKNRSPWKESRHSFIKGLTFIHDRSFRKHHFYSKIKNELHIFSKQNYNRPLSCISQGGAAMNALWTITQSPACYIKLPTTKHGGGSLWDFAASSILLQNLNGYSSDAYGNPLDLNRPNSTYMNHNGILMASNTILAKKILSIIKDY